MGLLNIIKTTSSSSSSSSKGGGDEYYRWWTWFGFMGLVVGMVAMEGCTVGLTIWTKTVMANGLSPYVYVVYTNALASSILLPCFFLFHSPRKPYFTFNLLNKFFLLGLIGIAMAQMLAFNGLSYSSPIVVATMSNLLPSISLLLSFILRTRKLHLRSTSAQVKLLGTLVSIMGALTVTFYKGPSVWSSPALFFTSSQQQQLQPIPILPPKPRLFLFASTPENWLLGSFLLAAATLCSSIWNVVQADTVKEYPDILTIVTFYSFFGTIQCGIVALIAERDDFSAWKVTSKMEIINIVLSALFGSVIRSGVQVWCMRRKGPIFVAMFKPFTIFVALTLGFLFFGNGLHIGSVVGALVVAVGYYSVMWGQLKEETEVKVLDDDSSTSISTSTSSSGGSSSLKAPLLQNQVHQNEQMEV